MGRTSLGDMVLQAVKMAAESGDPVLWGRVTKVLTPAPRETEMWYAVSQALGILTVHLEPKDPHEAMRVILRGEAVPELVRPRELFKQIPDHERIRYTVEAAVCAIWHDLQELAVELPEDQEAVDRLRHLMEERDVIEGIRILLRGVGKETMALRLSLDNVDAIGEELMLTLEPSERPAWDGDGVVGTMNPEAWWAGRFYSPLTL